MSSLINSLLAAAAILCVSPAHGHQPVAFDPDVELQARRLTEHVYDQDFDRDSNLIEVYVRRLRDKLGSGQILTRRGQGYLFPERPE